MALFLVAGAPRVCASGSPKPTTIGHHQYLKLKTVASANGMHVAQLSSDTVAIENKGGSVLFYPGQRKAVFDGIDVYLNGDLLKAHGDWFLSEVDRRDVIDPLLKPARHLKDYECDRVVLDPGHGGADSGAISPAGHYEKNLVLDISRRTAEILRANNLEVHLTRDVDKDLQLGFRPRIAKNRSADIFVSIHLNAANNKSARGIETFRLTASGFPSVENAAEVQFNPASYEGNGFNGANALLGYHIQKSLLTVTGASDRGLRHARYVVLKNVDCPAVLVECGFLSNRADEQQLASPEYRAKVALGIANGIMQYRAAISRTKLLTSPVEASVPDV